MGTNVTIWKQTSWCQEFSAPLALCEGYPPHTSGFPSQIGSNSELLCFFSCDQAAIWLVQSIRLSVRPSVRLSVRHTFFTMFPSWYHNEIFRSYYHGQKWCPCKRWRSEVKGQGHRGQHPTKRFPDSNSSLNSHMAMKSCTQLEAS